jgi:hypothetical protein
MTNLISLIVLFILSLLYGLTTPGWLIVSGLKEVFNLSVNSEPVMLIEKLIVLVISLIPWLILEITIEANKKKWTFFVKAFILMYTICGAMQAIGYFLEEDYIRKNMPL